LPVNEAERRDQLLLLLLLFVSKFLIQGHSYILGLCQIIILSSNTVTSRAISVCHQKKTFQLVTRNRNVSLKQVGRSCKSKLQYVPALIEVPRDYRVLLANVIDDIPKGICVNEIFRTMSGLCRFISSSTFHPFSMASPWHSSRCPVYYFNSELEHIGSSQNFRRVHQSSHYSRTFLLKPFELQYTTKPFH